MAEDMTGKHSRLFELIRQRNVMAEREAMAKGQPVPSPAEAQLFQSQAERSFAR